MEEYTDVFREVPGKVRGVEHHIRPPLGKVVVVPFRSTPITMKVALEQEVQTMMALWGHRGIH